MKHTKVAEIPSITAAELAHYDQLVRVFKDSDPRLRTQKLKDAGLNPLEYLGATAEQKAFSCVLGLPPPRFSGSKHHRTIREHLVRRVVR